MSPHRPLALITALALSAVAVLTLSAGMAQELTPYGAVQDRIDEAIAEFGGEQTAWNEVSWGDGDVRFIAALPGTSVTTHAIGTAADMVKNCPTGQHCVFAGAGYAGEKLVFKSCTANQSVSVLSSVRSIANNRFGKTVRAYKATTLLVSVPANSGRDVKAGTTKVTCS